MTEKPLVSAAEMASVLSGSDDLSSGPAAERKVSDRYSLRRPVVISADLERAATERLGLMASALGDAMARVLGAEIEIEVHGFQQQQVRAALDRLSGPPWVLYFTNPEGGGMALALDPPSGLALVELSLGGAGALTADGRTPTPLESRVMLSLAAAMRGILAEGKAPAPAGAGFRLASLGKDFGPPGEIVGAGLLRIRLGGTERTGLLLATADLLVDDDDENSDGDEEAVGPLHELLMDVELPLRPVLRGGELALADLVNLKEGSVLRLDVDQSEALWLTVRGVPLLRGRIQRKDGKAFLRIVKRSGDEVENAERNS